MDAKRLLILPLVAGALALSALTVGGIKNASAEVVGAEVPGPLAAAIRADIEARGYQYGGDCKFDAMYLRPGVWCSFVESMNSENAAVTYGPFASDDVVRSKFVRTGQYAWSNPATGASSPERVPALSAQPGPKPDSWLISAINFAAGQDVTLFDGSGCGGEQRCPGDHQLATTRAGADGAFQVTVSLEPNARPVPGQVHRLIQAGTGPFVQVAFHHDGGVPQPTPNSGEPPQPSQPSPDEADTGKPDASDGDAETASSDNGDTAMYGGIAAVALAFVSVAGVVTVRRRRA